MFQSCHIERNDKLYVVQSTHTHTLNRKPQQKLKYFLYCRSMCISVRIERHNRNMADIYVHLLCMRKWLVSDGNHICISNERNCLSNRFWAVSILKGDGTQIIFQLKKKCERKYTTMKLENFFRFPALDVFLMMVMTMSMIVFTSNCAWMIRTTRKKRKVG